MSLRAPSNLALNTSREEAATASLGNLCQCFTILMVKNFFLVSNLNLPSFSLQPFPLVLSVHTLVKSPSPSFLYAPFRYWKAAIRSPRSLLLVFSLFYSHFSHDFHTPLNEVPLMKWGFLGLTQPAAAHAFPVCDGLIAV